MRCQFLYRLAFFRVVNDSNLQLQTENKKCHYIITEKVAILMEK